MYENTFQKAFCLIAFLLFSGSNTINAQTPSTDLDSITEDSYRRMQERQAAEKKSDSLLKSQLELEVERLHAVKRTYWNNVIVIIVIVGVVFVYWYIRRISRTRDS